MTDFTHVGNVTMSMSVSSNYTFSRANCAEIRKDLEYFLAESQRIVDPVVSKRYARTAIVFTAFYVESLGNLLLAQTRAKFPRNDNFESYLEKSCGWPRPLHILLAVYLLLFKQPFVAKGREKTIPIDLSAVNDLFLLRNQVLAHPPARSIVAGTGVNVGRGLTENGTQLSLLKFTHFPNIYAEFCNSHAKEIFDAIIEFITRYKELIAKNPTDPSLGGIFG